MKTGFSPANTLGVIVCYTNKQKRPPFSEAPYFQALSREGKKLGIQVLVFNPKEINWKTRNVLGWYVLENGQWLTGIKPIPTLIYDRCYYVDSRHYLEYKPFVMRIAQDPQIRLLGRALGGKMQTYELLKKNPDIKPYLPLTIRYQHPNDVIRFIQDHSSALIKPNGGSHGRGVVAITRHAQGYLVRGRSKWNKPFQILIKDQEQLVSWIKQFIQDTRYIIQPFLPLTTPDRRPFDLRILVQKNERREWETTGIAVRTGHPNMITSNLHGGGQALSLRPFIDQHFPTERVSSILEKIQSISRIVPPYIEQQHGPLLELGLDVGIDVHGNVWLIEVNSKPGRAIFIKTGELAIRRRAVQLPMCYAHSLLIGI